MPTSDTSDQNPDEVIDLLAELLAGLQAPGSLGPRLLGEAHRPWVELHGRIGFGWHTKEQIAEWLDEVLQ